MAIFVLMNVINIINPGFLSIVIYFHIVLYITGDSPHILIDFYVKLSHLKKSVKVFF